MGAQYTTKHLEFIFHDYSESGKTRIYNVYNTTTNQSIGRIKWAGNFRKYAFYPENNTFYDAQCLVDISEFLKSEMNRRINNEDS